MKRLLTILLLLGASTPSFGERMHPLPTVDGRINFMEIVSVDGAPKDEIYSKARIWFATAFSTSDGMLLDDKESGIIVGKGVITTREGDSRVRTLMNPQITEKTWTFTVKIQIRDGRYKVELYDIEYTFAMPGNNIGHTPSTHNLDKLFGDRKIYKRDGTLKGGAPTNIANWTNETLSGLLESLKTRVTEQIVLDDF